MRKSEANKFAEAQLQEWLKRNREPGVLPCVPLILISQLCGEKPGITMNFNAQIPLSDLRSILASVLAQVETKLKELEAN